jgi:hypothetical protein
MQVAGEVADRMLGTLEEEVREAAVQEGVEAHRPIPRHWRY